MAAPTKQSDEKTATDVARVEPLHPLLIFYNATLGEFQFFDNRGRVYKTTANAWTPDRPYYFEEWKDVSRGPDNVAAFTVVQNESVYAQHERILVTNTGRMRVVPDAQIAVAVSTHHCAILAAYVHNGSENPVAMPKRAISLMNVQTGAITTWMLVPCTINRMISVLHECLVVVRENAIQFMWFDAQRDFQITSEATWLPKTPDDRTCLHELASRPHLALQGEDAVCFAQCRRDLSTRRREVRLTLSSRLRLDRVYELIVSDDSIVDEQVNAEWKPLALHVCHGRHERPFPGRGWDRLVMPVLSGIRRTRFRTIQSTGEQRVTRAQTISRGFHGVDDLLCHLEDDTYLFQYGLDKDDGFASIDLGQLTPTVQVIKGLGEHSTTQFVGKCIHPMAAKHRFGILVRLSEALTCFSLDLVGLVSEFAHGSPYIMV